MSDRIREDYYPLNEFELWVIHWDRTPKTARNFFAHFSYTQELIIDACIDDLIFPYDQDSTDPFLEAIEQQPRAGSYVRWTIRPRIEWIDSWIAFVYQEDGSVLFGLGPSPKAPNLVSLSQSLFETSASITGAKWGITNTVYWPGHSYSEFIESARDWDLPRMCEGVFDSGGY